MPSKFRSDFAKVALKTGAIMLVAAVVYTDAMALQQQTEEAVKTATQPIAAPRHPGQEDDGPLPLVKKFAEIFAGVRDDRDRINDIAKAIELQKSTAGASHRIAPSIAAKPT